MKASIAGKVALVSGATRGLGRELATQLADAGADLVLLARNRTELERVAEEIRKRGTKCDAIVCDLSKTDEIVAAAAQVNAAGSVDILINNAGLGYYKSFLEHSPEEHDAILDVNLRGMIHLTQRLLPPMLDRRAGHRVQGCSSRRQGRSGIAATSTKRTSIAWVQGPNSEIDYYLITLDA